jgi:hypothetical protein
MFLASDVEELVVRKALLAGSLLHKSLKVCKMSPIDITRQTAVPMTY